MLSGERSCRIVDEIGAARRLALRGPVAVSRSRAVRAGGDIGNASSGAHLGQRVEVQAARRVTESRSRRRFSASAAGRVTARRARAGPRAATARADGAARAAGRGGRWPHAPRCYKT